MAGEAGHAACWSLGLVGRPKKIEENRSSGRRRVEVVLGLHGTRSGSRLAPHGVGGRMEARESAPPPHRPYWIGGTALGSELGFSVRVNWPASWERAPSVQNSLSDVGESSRISPGFSAQRRTGLSTVSCRQAAILWADSLCLGLSRFARWLSLANRGYGVGCRLSTMVGRPTDLSIPRAVGNQG